MKCFMRGCRDEATTEDACPLHASPDQLRRVVIDQLAEIKQLLLALTVAADSCHRDRREPDKILCHVLTMRREVNHVSG